jgi:hypothetical protein
MIATKMIYLSTDSSICYVIITGINNRSLIDRAKEFLKSVNGELIKFSCNFYLINDVDAYEIVVINNADFYDTKTEIAK